MRSVKYNGAAKIRRSLKLLDKLIGFLKVLLSNELAPDAGNAQAAHSTGIVPTAECLECRWALDPVLPPATESASCQWVTD
jgi:hypothetical protein